MKRANCDVDLRTDLQTEANYKEASFFYNFYLFLKIYILMEIYFSRNSHQQRSLKTRFVWVILTLKTQEQEYSL